MFEEGTHPLQAALAKTTGVSPCLVESLVTGVTDSARPLPRAPLGAFATEFDLYKP